MTAASYTEDLTDIYAGAGSTTNWSALGGGASGLNAETDYFIQGTGCTTKNAFASATKGMIFNSGSDQGGSGTDGAYVMWLTQLTPNSLDTKAGGGIQMLIGSSTSDYRQYYVGGSDTIPFEGWIFAAVKEQNSNWDATTGSPSTTAEQYFGALFDLPSGGPTKGAPNAIDAIRFGRCTITITNGTAPDAAATFSGVLTNLETATNRYGLLAQREPGGAFENSGRIQFGTAGTQVRFVDSDKVIFIRDHDHVTANFHTWEVNNASSVVTLTNIVVKALGTTSPGRWLTNADATITLTTCQFINMGTFGFDANSTVNTCTFQGCNTVSPAEADMSGCSFLSSSVAADGAAVSWDETISSAHTISELDNTTYSMGANNHHAISFSTNVSNGADITLNNIEFTGFDADGTGDSDNSILEFLATTGTITVNLVGCTVDGASASSSNFTVDTRAGCTVNVNFDPKTLLVNVKNRAGTNVQNARVLVETSEDQPSGEIFEAAVTSITQSAGTATVTTTAAHRLETGDKVVIRGAQPDGYNKHATATVSSTTVFTYPVDSGLSSPATGTPVVSYVAIQGLTDASGNISISRTWGVDQAFSGWARKASDTLKQSEFSVTVDSANGNTINVVLQPDE